MACFRPVHDAHNLRDFYQFDSAFDTLLSHPPISIRAPYAEFDALLCEPNAFIWCVVLPKSAKDDFQSPYIVRCKEGVIGGDNLAVPQPLSMTMRIGSKKSAFGQKRTSPTLGQQMSLKEDLLDFAGSLATATDYPPDDYPSWSSWTYEAHMDDLRSLWSAIMPRLKKDADKIEFIDQNLKVALAAFEAKDKDKGRKAILAIYNLNVRSLR
tara:strand:- start:149 stop:781 length:633 start_codon:yes stop_codon:yes gene_type:complete